jgi:hypothetical protein
MDNLQSFLIHDKVKAKIEAIMEDFGYDIPGIFNFGIQMFDYFIRMKEEGWEVGIWQKNENGIAMKKMAFPHEAEFQEAQEADEDMEFIDEDDEDDEEDWLNIQWKD